MGPCGTHREEPMMSMTFHSPRSSGFSYQVLTRESLAGQEQALHQGEAATPEQDLSKALSRMEKNGWRLVAAAGGMLLFRSQSRV